MFKFGYTVMLSSPRLHCFAICVASIIIPITHDHRPIRSIVCCYMFMRMHVCVCTSAVVENILYIHVVSSSTCNK